MTIKTNTKKSYDTFNHPVITITATNEETGAEGSYEITILEFIQSNIDLRATCYIQTNKKKIGLEKTGLSRIMVSIATEELQKMADDTGRTITHGVTLGGDGIELLPKVYKSLGYEYQGVYDYSRTYVPVIPRK